MIKVLDIKIEAVNFDQALQKIDDFWRGQSTRCIVTPNPEIILEAQTNSRLKEALNQADLSLPDGAGLIIGSQFKIKQRVTGTDIFFAILKKYPQARYKFVIRPDGLSTKKEVIARAGVAIDEINPEIIFIGLGCPQQELWLAEQKDKYPSAKIIMTVGGAFDFLTGRQKRAPRWMRQSGLEWFWRLIKQPWRYQRIFNATIKFTWKVLFS